MGYLELKNLTVEFSGFRAVNEVNLSIEKGELHTLIGPNGAGKTTIIDMITGKTKPPYGSILLNGEDIAGKDPYVIASKYKVGRKFQGPNVFDYMTVEENIEVALSGFHTLGKTFTYRRKKVIKDEIDKILEVIRLKDKKDVLSVYLAHGQKQWLEIGMLLAQKPEIITLDEPTTGMTADETYKTGELILDVMKDKTLIVVEHDIDFVKQISQKITVLNQGEILAEGNYDEITSNQEVINVYLSGGVTD